jgi:hypothetical protein
MSVEHLVQHVLGVLGRESLALLERGQLSVDAGHGVCADLQVKVRPLTSNYMLQRSLEVQHHGLDRRSDPLA